MLKASNSLCGLPVSSRNPEIFHSRFSRLPLTTLVFISMTPRHALPSPVMSLTNAEGLAASVRRGCTHTVACACEKQEDVAKCLRAAPLMPVSCCTYHGDILFGRISTSLPLKLGLPKYVRDRSRSVPYGSCELLITTSCQGPRYAWTPVFVYRMPKSFCFERKSRRFDSVGEKLESPLLVYLSRTKRIQHTLSDADAEADAVFRGRWMYSTSSTSKAWEYTTSLHPLVAAFAFWQASDRPSAPARPKGQSAFAWAAASKILSRSFCLLMCPPNSCAANSSFRGVAEAPSASWRGG
mmetsp:Transcript_1224/g.5187  ORF Transcript_1224/g.5187 Transcript_1224/m.5187 type:complete len:296 (+) Transcript_1224:3392-4279(+)